MRKSVETRAAVVISVAALDGLFAVCHLCQYFFRLKRFNFIIVHKSIQPLYQVFWISLFAKHILQMFLSGSLFLCVRDIHTPSLLRSLVLTCQFWCGVSTIFILSSLVDGILLSIATLSLEFSENILQIVIVLKSEISIEVVIHIMEVTFRLVGLCSIHRFINEFLCYDMIIAE